MRTNLIIAVVLIAIGIISFAYQGITYKTREKVIEIGNVEVTAEKTKEIPLPPVIGAVALVCGIILLIKDRKKG